MIHTKRELLEKLHYIENNTVWKWQVEHLEAKISTLQRVLIDSGVLVNARGVKASLIIVDGEPYTIASRKEK